MSFNETIEEIHLNRIISLIVFDYILFMYIIIPEV